MNVCSTYIHYHFENYNGPSPGPFLVEEVKNQIMQTFINRFKAQQTGAAKNMKDEDVQKLLEEISSNGQVGQAIINQINNIAFDPSKGPMASKIVTGAGIGVGGGGATTQPQIQEWAAKTAKQVREALQSMIDVAGKSQLYILKAQLKAIKEGQSIPNLNGKKIEGVFSKSEIDLASLESEAAAKNLKEKLIILDDLAQGQGSTDLSLAAIGQSIRGSFSTIGGRMFEPVVVHAANCVTCDIDEAFLTANDNIRKTLPKGSSLNDFDLKAAYTGAIKSVSGQDLKGDIRMTYTKNGISYTISGSLKLSQQQDVLRGKSLKISNLQSSFNLGEYIRQGFIVSGNNINSMQWYEAALGAIKINKTKFSGSSEYNAARVSWTQMIEYSKYAAALRMLTGSGGLVKTKTHGDVFDFASVFVINNRIYSGYSIMQELVKNFDAHAKMTGASPSSFSTTRGQITRKFNQYKWDKDKTPEELGEQRSKDTIEIIQKLYNKRITMSLNFMGLNFS